MVEAKTHMRRIITNVQIKKDEETLLLFVWSKTLVKYFIINTELC